METNKVVCPACGGRGWTQEMEHDCGGDAEQCVYRCPIAVQVPCEKCETTGLIDAPGMAQKETK